MFPSSLHLALNSHRVHFAYLPRPIFPFRLGRKTALSPSLFLSPANPGSQEFIPKKLIKDIFPNKSSLP